jgi:hypothetical protein
MVEGKVSRIVLSGDRGDPVNLLQFVGTVENVMQTFDPSVGKAEGESLKIAEKLGLRGAMQLTTLARRAPLSSRLPRWIASRRIRMSARR